MRVMLRNLRYSMKLLSRVETRPGKGDCIIVGMLEVEVGGGGSDVGRNRIPNRRSARDGECSQLHKRNCVFGWSVWLVGDG